jgi:hypothetical protein
VKYVNAISPGYIVTEGYITVPLTSWSRRLIDYNAWENCREPFAQRRTVILQKAATSLGIFGHSCAGNAVLLCDKGVGDTEEARMYVYMCCSCIRSGVAESNTVQ